MKNEHRQKTEISYHKSLGTPPDSSISIKLSDCSFNFNTSSSFCFCSFSMRAFFAFFEILFTGCFPDDFVLGGRRVLFAFSDMMMSHYGIRGNEVKVRTRQEREREKQENSSEHFNKQNRET